MEFKACVSPFALNAIHLDVGNFFVIFSIQEGGPLQNSKKKQHILLSGPAAMSLFRFISITPFLAHSITSICAWLTSTAAMIAIPPYADGSTLSPDSPAYLTNKCVVCNRNVTGGRAVFVREFIEAGELIGVWSGRIITTAQLDGLPENIRHHTVQVEEGQYLAWGVPNDAPDFINHSCEPNAGMDSQISIVALRRLFPGEEVTIDYAMCDGSAYDEFDCTCGSRMCRGRVRGDDWRRPVLWKRYGNHFSPYLARRIQALKQARAACECVVSVL